MPVLNNRNIEALETELKYRKARVNYYEYMKMSNRGFIPSKLGELIGTTIQDFIYKKNPSPAFDVLLISMPPQHGKLVSDNTPVLTTNGWVNHGDLKVGDYVYGLDGMPKLVTFVHPKYFADTLVTTKNGYEIKVHHDHEWVVHDRCKAGRPIIKLETKYIAENISTAGVEGKRGHSYRFSLPKITAIVGQGVAPVDPYTLGVWLGDGTTTKPCITMEANDLKYVLPYVTYSINKTHVHKTTGVPSVYFNNMAADFRKLGVMARSNEYGVRTKHIPSIFFTLSIHDRLELLAGIMDSDGYTYSKNGRSVISTCDEQLAEDVATLVATFGVVPTISVFEPKDRGRGIRDTPTVYQIGFNFDRPIPCKVPRKQVFVRPLPKRVAITSVTPLPAPVQGNCISVEGGIYLVGRGLTPTHNSLSITETLPSWYIGLNPDYDAIIISYNDDTASRFGRANRAKLEQFSQAPFDAVAPLFPEYRMSEPWNNNDIANTYGKYIRSRGVMSGITSNPAHLIVIDDPIKTMEEARSETSKDKVWNEYYASIRTRIKPYGKLVVIATRWVEDDLIGRLLKTVPSRRLTTLFIPAECNNPETDPLGRKLGEPLAPEIGRGADWLREFKEEYAGEQGLYAWSALYQCDPTPIEGAIIDPAWWKYYRYEDEPPVSNIYISVDAAFKATNKSNFVVGQVWGMVGTNYYLLTQVRDRLTFTQTLEMIRDLTDRYPNHVGILIEDKANGSAIINSLQNEYDNIIPVAPAGGKESRLHAVSKQIRQGRVHLPSSALWLDSYIRKFTSFPNGTNDDQVNATTQVLNYMLYSFGDDVLTNTDKNVKIKIREWSEDMYEDYYGANETDRNRLISLWGYPQYGFNDHEEGY